MQYVSLVFVAFLLLYFLVQLIKAFSKPGKKQWKLIKEPLLAVALALVLIDQLLKR